MAAATLVHLVHRSGRIGSYRGCKRAHLPVQACGSSSASVRFGPFTSVFDPYCEGFDSRHLHSQPRGDAGFFFAVYQGRRERDPAHPRKRADSLRVHLIRWYTPRADVRFLPFAPVCDRYRPFAGRFTTSCPLQRRPTLGSYPRLTPRLRRTCIPGVVASFTMRSDTLFTDTSCPLNGLPICVIWYATLSSWVNQPGRRKGVIEVGDLDDGHRVAVQVEHAAVPLARHLAVDPHRADEDEGA